MKRRALITGIAGQDGSYLAELLLEKDYEVHGVVRRVALEDRQHKLNRLIPILDRIQIHSASVESYPAILKVLEKVRPHEVYHLAAASFVSDSPEDELSTLQGNVLGVHNILATARDVIPDGRIYFAGSSEMYGDCGSAPQNEDTAFQPRSVYGISKLAGLHLARSYRDKQRMYTATGILYNHESPRRGFEFVTRKITSHVARLANGANEALHLGNLDARRDWGHARDYVAAMWRMLQQPEPRDFVIGTGTMHSVRDFLEIAFGAVDLDYKRYVVVDPALYREDRNPLVADAGRARRELGWQPTISFESLVKEMVDADLQAVSARAILQPAASQALRPAARSIHGS